MKQNSSDQFLVAQTSLLGLAGLMAALGISTIAEAQFSNALANAAHLCGINSIDASTLLGHCAGCWIGAAELLGAAMLVGFSIRLRFFSRAAVRV